MLAVELDARFIRNREVVSREIELVIVPIRMACKFRSMAIVPVAPAVRITST